MGFLDKLFGKKRSRISTTAADQARSQELAGRETGQTVAEQDATRGRMEAEMDAQRQRRADAATPAVPPCPHTALTPAWDSVAAMGDQDQVSRYTCQACQQVFSAAAGRALLATEAERLRQQLET